MAIAEQSDSGGEEVQGAAGGTVNVNPPKPPRLPNPHPRNNRGYYNLTFDMDFPTEDVQSSESQSCEGPEIKLLPLQEPKHDSSLQLDEPHQDPVLTQPQSLIREPIPH